LIFGQFESPKGISFKSELRSCLRRSRRKVV